MDLPAFTFVLTFIVYSPFLDSSFAGKAKLGAVGQFPSINLFRILAALAYLSRRGAPGFDAESVQLTAP
jgi:hypothetical protein